MDLVESIRFVPPNNRRQGGEKKICFKSRVAFVCFVIATRDV